MQIARAFTGWDYDDKGAIFLDDYDHDFTDQDSRPVARAETDLPVDRWTRRSER